MIRRVRGGSTRYYFQHPDGSQPPLGGDFDEAVKKWTAMRVKPLNGAQDVFSTIAKEFRTKGLTEVSPRTKKRLSAKTQKEYEAALDRLEAVFKDAPMATIKPVHVGKLLDELAGTPVLANRIKATLSRMWNWARSRGKTDLPNPCTGVEGYAEEVRTVLVTAEMFWAIYDRGDQVLRDWMRLDIVIGQRVSDITRIMRTDVVTDGDKKDALRYRSTKTGTLGLMAVERDLKALIEELKERKRKATGPWLLQTDEGQRVTHAMLRNRFDDARIKAREDLGEIFIDWQMRDLRKTSLNQAATLEEARRRGLHTDPRTTARHYEVRIDTLPGSIPMRPEEAELLTSVSNSDKKTG
jgi:hypothetical protein